MSCSTDNGPVECRFSGMNVGVFWARRAPTLLTVNPVGTARRRVKKDPETVTTGHDRQTTVVQSQSEARLPWGIGAQWSLASNIYLRGIAAGAAAPDQRHVGAQSDPRGQRPVTAGGSRGSLYGFLRYVYIRARGLFSRTPCPRLSEAEFRLLRSRLPSTKSKKTTSVRYGSNVFPRRGEIVKNSNASSVLKNKEK